MQTFPGWRNGYHVGWDSPYRFPNRDLYMGTYDEGSPEATDWQLKWMAEHGVDFFIDCWYAPVGCEGNPIKDSHLGYGIHDGYFNSQYSNSVKFAIANCSTPTSVQNFKDYYVPFWIENYFKDPRYMVIDNKPVLSIFAFYTWLNTLGSVAAVQDALGFLRTEAVNAGFAGVYIMTTYNGSNVTEMNSYNEQGIDYCYAYGFSTADINTMEAVMTNEKNAGSTLGVLPTLSSGWNKDAWDMTPDADDGFVSAADFQTLANWAKNTFMPSLPAGTLGRQMVMLGNWNEYGEGHYINPSALNGFGYLDALRSVFAANPTHTDTAPTSAQKLRMNTLFPKGWVGHSWNFDGNYSDTEGWGSLIHTGYTEYIIDMSTVAGWTGALKQLRIDPVNSGATTGTFKIDYIIITD